MENKSMSVLKSAVRTQPQLTQKTRLETKIDTKLALVFGEAFSQFIKREPDEKKKSKGKAEVPQAPASEVTPVRTSKPSALVKKGLQKVYHIRNGKEMLYWANEQTDGIYLLYAERPDRKDLVYAGWMVDLSQMDDDTRKFYDAGPNLLLTIYNRFKMKDPDAKARCDLANSYINDKDKGIISGDDNQIGIAVEELAKMRDYVYISPFIEKGVRILDSKLKTYQTATMTNDTVLNNGVPYDNGYIYPKFLPSFGRLYIGFFDKNGNPMSIENRELDVILNAESVENGSVVIKPYKLKMMPDNRAVPSKTGEVVSNEPYNHIFISNNEDLKGMKAVGGAITNLAVTVQSVKKRVPFHASIGKLLNKMQGGLYGADEVLYDRISATLTSGATESLKSLLKILTDKKDKIPDEVKSMTDKIEKYELNLSVLSDNLDKLSPEDKGKIDKTKEKISDYESEITDLKRAVLKYETLYSEIDELFKLVEQHPIPEEESLPVSAGPETAKSVEFDIKPEVGISPEIASKMQKTRKWLSTLENIYRDYGSLIGLLKISLDLGTRLLTKDTLDEIKALNNTYIEGRDAISAERQQIITSPNRLILSQQLDQKRDDLELEIIDELFKIFSTAAKEKPETRTEGPSGNIKLLGSFMSVANNLKQKKEKKTKKAKPEKTEQTMSSRITEYQHQLKSNLETYRNQYNSVDDKSKMADPKLVLKACKDYVDALIKFSKEYETDKSLEPPKPYWKDGKFTPVSTGADPIPGIAPFHFEGTDRSGNYIKYIFMDSSAVSEATQQSGSKKINQKTYEEFLMLTKNPEVNQPSPTIKLEQALRKLVGNRKDLDELIVKIKNSETPQLNPSLDDPRVKELLSRINDGETLEHPIPFTWLKPGICHILDIMVKYYIPNPEQKGFDNANTDPLRYYYIYDYIKNHFEHGGISFNVDLAKGPFSREQDLLRTSPSLSKTGKKAIGFDEFDYLPLPLRWYETHKYVELLGGIIRTETGEYDTSKPRLISANSLQKLGIPILNKEMLQNVAEVEEKKEQKETGQSVKNKLISFSKIIKPEKKAEQRAPSMAASPDDYLSSAFSAELAKKKAEQEKAKGGEPAKPGIFSKFINKEDKDFSVEFSLIEE